MADAAMFGAQDEGLQGHRGVGLDQGGGGGGRLHGGARAPPGAAVLRDRRRGAQAPAPVGARGLMRAPALLPLPPPPPRATMTSATQRPPLLALWPSETAYSCGGGRGGGGLLGTATLSNPMTLSAKAQIPLNT